MTKLDNLLETIYDKYVNIKMTLNNLLPEDPSKIQNEFSDKVYSLEDLDKTIQQKNHLFMMIRSLCMVRLLSQVLRQFTKRFVSITKV